MVEAAPHLRDKEKLLEEMFRQSDSLLVAYSGGVDSAYLLHAAHAVLGDRCRGVIGDSPSLPRAELKEALDLAQARGWSVTVLQTHELANPDYAANPLNRCFYCKHELFSRLDSHARAEGFATIAYGENADDAADFRPGRQAADQFQILAPLKSAGLTKADIRFLSAVANLPTSHKPALPCLASRLPTGQPVTLEKLAQIEQGEILLRTAGFHIFRLRHHGQEARIQAASSELPRLLDPLVQQRLTPALQELGFRTVSFLSEPYQGASLR